MSSLERSLELLDGYCRAVGASSASEENVVGCLQYMDSLEAELDATIGVLNIRNDLQRKTLERTKLHCEQKLRYAVRQFQTEPYSGTFVTCFTFTDLSMRNWHRKPNKTLQGNPMSMSLLVKKAIIRLKAR